MMLSGNNGILTRAGEAKESTERAKEEEAANLSFTTVQMDLAQGKTVDTVTFQSIVDGNFGSGNATGTIGGNSYIITVKRTGINYQMDSSGNVVELTELPIDFAPGVLEGNGTTNDPYVINSIEDLVAVSYNVNTGNDLYEGKVLSLGRDLNFQEDASYANANAKYKYTSSGCIPDANSTTTIKELMIKTTGNGFTPIGFSNTSFKGTFDGKGKYLTNLYIKVSGLNGLFGIISTNITIKDLNLNKCNIKGDQYTGGIAALNMAANLSISGCTVNGNIESQQSIAGGIVGFSNGQLLNISHCSTSGNLTGKKTSGGIVGMGGKVNVLDCHNDAIIISKEAPAGGIIGQGNGTIEVCYNTGKINSLQAYNGIGGIAGTMDADSNVFDCNNTGNIGEETSGMNSGGIVGYGSDKKIKIINCCNSGKILSKNNSGGIIGGNTKASIKNCYNFGVVICASSPAGGIIGIRKQYCG